MISIGYVTIPKFCQESGYTVDAVNTKIRDGVWLENKVWIKALDGRRLISIEGYNLWVEMAMVLRKRHPRAMKSPSPIEASAVEKGSSSSPPPLTANG